MSRRRINAIVRKELRDYRHNPYTLMTMAIVPLIFLLQPLISVLSLPAGASIPLSRHDQLLYMLGIPALVPALVAASSIVTERAQGTLEPVLATPIRRDEFVLAKALAPLVPSVLISYAVYELFAQPGVAPALLKTPVVIAQIVFTPLIAAWSIWVGLAISTVASDIRAAQQLSLLGNLPLVALVVLVAFDVIEASTALAVGLAAALLVGYRVGWRVVSALFDRERLIANTR